MNDIGSFDLIGPPLLYQKNVSFFFLSPSLSVSLCVSSFISQTSFLFLILSETHVDTFRGSYYDEMEKYVRRAYVLLAQWSVIEDPKDLIKSQNLCKIH